MLSSQSKFTTQHINTKKYTMKKLFAAAFSVLLLSYAATSSFAQEADEDGILNEKIGRDREMLPGSSHYNEGNTGAHKGHWSHLTTIALSPFQYTESGVGVGLSYERAIDHEGMLSVYVPAIASFRLRNNDYNSPYYYGYGYNNETNYLVTLMPGVKFYPTGMGRVKYAVGPNAVIGYGRRTMYDNYVYTPLYSSYPPYYGTYERWMLGMMINNSVNVNATPHLYIGAEMGFGFSYFDNIGGINYGVRFLTQGAFKVGYTF
jgi:hypothetical protein